MSMSLQRYQESVRFDGHGNEIGPIEGQIGWYVRKQTTGRPSAVLINGEPLSVPPDAQVSDLRRFLDGWSGCVRLYPFDEHGDVIEDAPVAVVFLEPDLSGSKPEHTHWMRLDRVFDMCDRFISVLEAKDMMLTRVTDNLIENQRDLQSGAAELLRAASSAVNVASGIERPELDMDMMSERIAEAVEDKAKDRDRAPWFVQLADTKLGQGVVDMVAGFTAKLSEMQRKNK